MRCKANTRAMLIDPSVPRIEGADWPGIALCHPCQRAAYHAGGFLELLRRSVEKHGTNSYYARAKP